MVLLLRTDISQALRARRLEYKERMMLKKQVGWTMSNILEIYWKYIGNVGKIDTSRLRAQERTIM